MTERNWRVVASQLPDCKKGMWYIVDCEVKGIIGMCADTLEELKATTKPAILELFELNGRPTEETFEIAA